jgi:hypothetical protein
MLVVHRRHRLVSRRRQVNDRESAMPEEHVVHSDRQGYLALAIGTPMRKTSKLVTGKGQVNRTENAAHGG